MILLDKANQYVEDVLSGKEVTTWEVKRQCEIYKEDLIKQNRDDFAYYFDEKKIKIINNLLKLMNYATGFVAGQPILDNLANFQAFLLVNVFGWRFKNNPKKFKHKDITLYIARKNSKTAICAIIYILLMLTEQEYSEFYSICLSKELASEIRKAMTQILDASPLIGKHFKISRTFTGKIECKLTKSFFQPRVNEAGKNNSVRCSALCWDEAANFIDKNNFLAMKSGMRNVINPLIFKTTTGYPLSGSVIIEELDYIRSVFKGDVTDDRQFALVYYADKEHLWDDIGIHQANPLRIEENYEVIREDRAKALIIESEKEEYLTKSMNVMLETNTQECYIEMDLWRKCRQDKIDFKGKRVMVGVDMSSTQDLTAVSMMYVENGNIYCMSHGFLPEIGLEKRRESVNYRAFERAGYCDIHKGLREIDYKLVEEYIRNLELKYGCIIDTIVVDPKFAQDLTRNLKRDYDTLPLGQTFTNLSGATKDFRRKVYNGQCFYEKNELLDWNMSNAITVPGKADDEMIAKFNKFKNKVRIDLVAVLVFAYTQLVVESEGYDPIQALKDGLCWI